MITYQYEEYKPVGRVRRWLAILLLAVITLSWGMVTHMAVPDVPRHWDFDTLADTPASSPYATVPPPQVKVVPAQIELPPDYAGQDVNVP
jgi:uncharacterized membrane protein